MTQHNSVTKPWQGHYQRDMTHLYLPISVIHQINRIKKKKMHGHFNRYTKKTWWNSTLIMIKMLSKRGGNFLNLIKSIYKKLTTKIILNGGSCFPYEIRVSLWKFTFTILFYIVIEVLGSINEIRKRYKKQKGWEKSSCYGLNCAPWPCPNSCVKVLTFTVPHNVTVFRDRTFKDVIKAEWGHIDGF